MLKLTCFANLFELKGKNTFKIETVFQLSSFSRIMQALKNAFKMNAFLMLDILISTELGGRLVQ